jgi:hypothetical protein
VHPSRLVESGEHQVGHCKLLSSTTKFPMFVGVVMVKLMPKWYVKL